MTITVDVPAAWWITANQRIHHMTRAARTRDIRALARHAARDHQPVGAVSRLVVTVGIPTARRFDPPNSYPTLKAAVDGLVDAGVLDDDDHTHIPELTFRRGPKSPRGIYRLTLELQP